MSEPRHSLLRPRVPRAAHNRLFTALRLHAAEVTRGCVHVLTPLSRSLLILQLYPLHVITNSHFNANRIFQRDFQRVGPWKEAPSPIVFGRARYTLFEPQPLRRRKQPDQCRVCKRSQSVV